jgi:hypothetical protein
MRKIFIGNAKVGNGVESVAGTPDSTTVSVTGRLVYFRK